ncbi:MAG: hypothetical protein DRP14_01020 [Candidatus Aenigmatarchaeota archaeon]|nr:MAG: hypothetical protein DRP14_01020 [Candidatus Aenigmarchaeota archaeon]
MRSENPEEVKEYLKAFKRWLEKGCYPDIAESYKSVPNYTPQPCTQEGIQELIVAMEDIGNRNYVELIDRIAGIYISYLVNGSPEKEIVLEISSPINYLGLYNAKKDWIIIGNVGNYVGRFMEGGKITVDGDAELLVGCSMVGGNIEIKGNAESFVGENMIGGEIKIRGKAGYGVGKGMIGGKITVDGDAENGVGERMRGGRIKVGNAGDGVGEEMEGGTIIVNGKVKKWTGNGMRCGKIYIADLDPHNLSKKIYGGNIYRGLPEEMGGKPELVVKDGEVLIKTF